MIFCPRRRIRRQPADASIARSGETLRQAEWRDELLRTGIRGKAGQYIRFARLEPLPGCRWLHADGETRPAPRPIRCGWHGLCPQRIVVSFGPEHAPLEQRQVELAIEEAQTLVPQPKLIVFAAFQFDPRRPRTLTRPNWPGVTLLKAQMNADLLTDDLKKKRASNESFWLIGQPDVQLERIAKGEDKGKCAGRGARLRLLQHRPATSNPAARIRSPSGCWIPTMTGAASSPARSFSPWRARRGLGRLARNLKAEIDEELIEAYRGTVSLPFAAGRAPAASPSRSWMTGASRA